MGLRSDRSPTYIDPHQPTGWVLDLVQLALAAVAWILPDIPPATKLIITFILMAVWVLARTGRLASWDIRNFQLAAMLLFSILISVIEFAPALTIPDPGTPDVQASLIRLAQVALTYAVVFGLPIQFLGYRFASKYHWGLLSLWFCLFQTAWFLVIVLIGYVRSTSAPHLLDTDGLFVDGLLFTSVGPLGYTYFELFSLAPAAFAQWAGPTIMSVGLPFVYYLQVLPFELTSRQLLKHYGQQQLTRRPPPRQAPRRGQKKTARKP